MVTIFASKVLIFKAMHRNEARRFALAEHVANFERVTDMVRYHFDIEEGEYFAVYYVNSFGDMIGLRSEEDFADACAHARTKSDLERELVLVVDREDAVAEVELAALASLTRRMQQLEVNLLNSMNEVNGMLGDGGDLLQLPRWVAREGLYYETVRADPPSALSDVEETELGSDLLASPRLLTVNTFANTSPLAEVIYEEDFEPYTDDDESCDGETAAATLPRALFARLISPAKEVRFRVPFPAFVPFPPSPAPSSHVFSLNETTPFPFPAPTASPACRCACVCSAPGATAPAAAAADVSVSVGAGDDARPTEKRPFKFFVSVGTQCAAPPSPLPSSPVVRSVSIGTQTETASESPAEVAVVLESVAATACTTGAQTEAFASPPSPLPSSPAASSSTDAEAAAAVEDEDADYEML